MHMTSSFSALLGPQRAELLAKMDITEVCPGLYLCAYDSLTEEKIRSRNITRIINAAHEAPDVQLEGIHLTHLPVSDIPSANISQFFDQCADMIRETILQGSASLVHCALGISRSVTICLVYMIKYEDVSLRQAYIDIKKRRPIIKPNAGFWRQLIEYEQQKRGVCTVKMVLFPMGSMPDVYLKNNARISKFG